VRLAFLGSGLATDIHSRTLAKIAPHVERWYASRERARAARTAARHKGAGVLQSYDAALTDPKVDAVLIGLPPALHLEWTLRALEAGKHVIVEKPPFLKADDVSAVESAATRADRQVLVAENYVYKPLTGLLRRVIERGDLGDVLFIQINALKRQATGDWRDDPDLAGGGALFEGGIHWISLLTSLGLTPGRVRAARPGPATGSERSMLVTIEFDEGAVASLALSWDLAALVNGLRVSRIYGTAGTLRFETNGLAAVLTGRRTRAYVPGLADLAGYRAMFEDFLRAIEQNTPPRYNLPLARRDLGLIEDAYKSAAR
jgi:predicted dehydrogenase